VPSHHLGLGRFGTHFGTRFSASSAWDEGTREVPIESGWGVEVYSGGNWEMALSKQ
jgi:hypothetical protein